MAEVVYSGRDGDTARMLYREYAGGVARPAFTQELSYDLSESSVVRFRSVEIEVKDATGSAVTYTVLDDGGLDWLPNTRAGQ